jgi:hypothetical protein
MITTSYQTFPTPPVQPPLSPEVLRRQFSVSRASVAMNMLFVVPVCVLYLKGDPFSAGAVATTGLVVNTLWHGVQVGIGCLITWNINRV